MELGFNGFLRHVASVTTFFKLYVSQNSFVVLLSTAELKSLRRMKFSSLNHMII